MCRIRSQLNRMKRIGLLSDTHGYLDPKIKLYFSEVDEIWHAGDIGTIEVLDELAAFKPTRAVWGNIDSHDIRRETKEFQRFKIEDLDILIIAVSHREFVNINPETFATMLRPGGVLVDVKAVIDASRLPKGTNFWSL